jgi:hypothetical protein
MLEGDEERRRARLLWALGVVLGLPFDLLLPLRYQNSADVTQQPHTRQLLYITMIHTIPQDHPHSLAQRHVLNERSAPPLQLDRE